MKRFIIFFIATSFGLVSCKKLTYKDTDISGIAYNQTDNNPLEGYEIYLIETETPSKPFSSVIRTTIATEVTDENGAFDFGEVQLNRRSRFEYTVEFDPKGENFKPDGWTGGEYEKVNLVTSVEKGMGNIINIGMITNGELKVLVYNENEYDTNDEIIVYAIYSMLDPAIKANYIGGGGYENESYNNRKGFLNTIAGYLTIEWHVTRNGQTEIFSDEIYLAHNEQRVYEIHY